MAKGSLKRKGIMKELLSQDRKDPSAQDVLIEWVSKQLLNVAWSPKNETVACI